MNISELKTTEPMLTFTHPPVERPAQREWVLQPLNSDSFDGWFRRGSLSVIAGPSGAGKSTLMLDLLCQQKEGKAYLGHATNEWDFLAIFADRPQDDVDQTLERMRLVGRVKGDHLPMCHALNAARAILAKVEKNHMPPVLFIEGGDFLVGDTIDGQSVAFFLALLQEIASRYYIAIILSTGAPKSKKTEEYQLKRDRIIGSQAWGRMCSTIAVMSIPDEDRRELDVLHRDAPQEHFDLKFDGGVLVKAPLEKEKQDPLWAWIAGVDWFERMEAVKEMKQQDAGPRQSTVYNKLEKWFREGKLETRKNPTTNKWELRMVRFAERVPELGSVPIWNQSDSGSVQ